MGTDDDIDIALRQAALFPCLLRVHEARKLAHLHGNPASVRRRSGMLARQQRRRHHHGHLAAAIATAKAVRNATSVLPKPTSPQTSRSIGRPLPRSSMVCDGFVLVLGFL